MHSNSNLTPALAGKNIHILVAEDDNDINSLLCSIIRRSGYEAQPAFSGTEALLYWEKQPWDMVLLDLMLPGLTGEELLEKMHAAAAHVPVLVISAKGDPKGKVAALRGGAADYITKPFDVEEVAARIDAHLLRYNQLAPSKAADAPEPALHHKSVTLDQASKTVSVSGTELTLTAREFELLALLMSQPKKVYSKANLYESVWGEPYYGDDNTMNVHMSNLRSKLAKANPGEEIIETIWGMGYRLKP